MAFYREYIRCTDEEDIWEQLKQILINSEAIKAEKKLQEAQEFEAFNKALRAEKEILIPSVCIERKIYENITTIF